MRVIAGKPRSNASAAQVIERYSRAIIITGHGRRSRRLLRWPFATDANALTLRLLSGRCGSAWVYCRRPLHFKFLSSHPLWRLRCLRLQKSTERFQRCFRDVMLDSFGISLSSLARHAQCEKYVHHKPMARSHPSS